MNDTKQVLDYIDTLKAFLEDAVTYGGFNATVTQKEFAEKRENVFSISRIYEYIPSYLKTRSKLSEIQSLAKEKGGYAERRLFITESFAPVLEFLHSELATPTGQPVVAAFTNISSASVRESYQKAIDRIANDPSGAITASRSLLEAVCKHILDDSGEQYSNSADLPDLFKITVKQMNLAPDQHSEPGLRQMLQGCVSVVQGVGAFRNIAGDAHGKSASAGLVEKHHAVLAVGAACSVASFLIESWEIHKAKNP